MTRRNELCNVNLPERMANLYRKAMEEMEQGPTIDGGALVHHADGSVTIVEPSDPYTLEDIEAASGYRRNVPAPMRARFWSTKFAPALS